MSQAGQSKAASATELTEEQKKQKKIDDEKAKKLKEEEEGKKDPNEKGGDEKTGDVPLEEQIKTYKFPMCQKGTDHLNHQLSKICVDARCRKDQVLEPLCIICEEYRVHSVPSHNTKSLKLVIKDLIMQTKKPTKEEMRDSEDEIQQSLTKIAMEFRSLSDRTMKLSNDVYTSLDIYNQTMQKESPKKKEVRRILENMLSTDSEPKLRNSLKKLVPLTVIENGCLRVNDDVSFSIKKAVENNSEKYIQIMRDSLRRLTQLVDSLLEISLLEGYEEVHDQLKNQNDIFDQTKMSDEERKKRAEQDKKEKEERKAEVEQLIKDHIETCDNKHCQEIKPNFGIGSWRPTDCYLGSKISREWLHFQDKDAGAQQSGDNNGGGPKEGNNGGPKEGNNGDKNGDGNDEGKSKEKNPKQGEQ